MKHLILSILLQCFIVVSQAQNFQWATTFPSKPFGGNSPLSNNISSDSWGNSYYSGAFSDSLRIGSFLLNEPGDNLYVAKLDVAGNVIWVKSFHSSGVMPGMLELTISNLKVDAVGNCYLGGSFEDQLTFDTITMDAAPYISVNLFLVKINASGKVVWAKHGTGYDSDRVTGLDLDAAGNVYVSGYSYGSLNLDGQFITSGAAEGFLFKLTSNGQLLWTREFRADNLLVAVQPNGSGFLTGNFIVDTLDLGNGISIPLDQNSNPSTAFAAGFSTNGQFQWGQQIGGGLQIRPVKARADAAGNLFLAGSFWGGVQYGTGAAAVSLTSTTSTDDCFLFKINANGGLDWAKSFFNLGSSPNGYDYNKIQLELDPHGNPVFANTHYDAVQLDLVYYNPVGPSHDIIIAKFHSNGNFLWYRTIKGSAEEYITGMSIGGNDLVISGEISTTATGTITQFGGLTHLTNSNSEFIARILDSSNSIEGKVFADLNGSGVWETGEPGVPYQQIKLQNGQSTFTDANGSYFLSTGPGSFQIALQQPPAYYSNVSGTHSAVFTGLNQLDTANHFALQPLANISDLQIDMVQLNPPRPGFSYRTKVTYKNVGTVVMDGTVKVYSDSLLTLLGTAPTVSGISADTLLWSFIGLQPLETRTIAVEWQVPASAALGSAVNGTALIEATTADQNLENNSVVVSEQIQGSFDPNDKLVSHRMLTPAQVSAGKWLTYTVRFQNTGTDTAFFAIVRDELSTLLDMNTLEVVSSSHPFTIQLTGANKVEWDFGTILLPDSNTNEAASHGYIQYRIKPLPTLTLGQHINTHANIFFDFNAPVITNITDTEVGVVTGIATQLKQQPIRIWPNPNEGRFMLQLPEKGRGTMQIQLVNALGEVVHQENRSAAACQELDLEKVASGVYMLQVSQNGKTYSGKMMLQK